MGKKRKQLSQKKTLKNLNSSNDSAIQCLYYANKSNGLVVGTNAVLRLLRKNSLFCVFLFSNKAPPPLYYFLASRCSSTSVLFFTLQEKDRILLGSEFPFSITYGIKKDYMSSHQKLNELQQEKQSDTNVKERKTIKVQHALCSENVSDLDEVTKCKKSDLQTFYHKKHSAKKIISVIDKTLQQDFLSLAEYSDPEEDFPVYKSVKWKNSDLIIK